MLCLISLLGCCRKDGTSPNGENFRITGPAPVFRRERLHGVPSTHQNPTNWSHLHQLPFWRADWPSKNYGLVQILMPTALAFCIWSISLIILMLNRARTSSSPCCGSYIFLSPPTLPIFRVQCIYPREVIAVRWLPKGIPACPGPP